MEQKKGSLRHRQGKNRSSTSEGYDSTDAKRTLPIGDIHGTRAGRPGWGQKETEPDITELDGGHAPLVTPPTSSLPLIAVPNDDNCTLNIIFLLRCKVV